MKIFRVHFKDSTGMSLGFAYHSNKKDAMQALETSNSANETETDKEDIEERELVIGKYEFLKLINEWASHPDNG